MFIIGWKDGFGASISGYLRQLHGRICREIRRFSIRMPTTCLFRYRWLLACLLFGCYGKGIDYTSWLSIWWSYGCLASCHIDSEDVGFKTLVHFQGDTVRHALTVDMVPSISKGRSIVYAPSEISPDITAKPFTRMSALTLTLTLTLNDTEITLLTLTLNPKPKGA